MPRDYHTEHRRDHHRYPDRSYDPEYDARNYSRADRERAERAERERERERTGERYDYADYDRGSSSRDYKERELQQSQHSSRDARESGYSKEYGSTRTYSKQEYYDYESREQYDNSSKARTGSATASNKGDASYFESQDQFGNMERKKTKKKKNKHKRKHSKLETDFADKNIKRKSLVDYPDEDSDSQLSGSLPATGARSRVSPERDRVRRNASPSSALQEYRQQKGEEYSESALEQRSPYATVNSGKGTSNSRIYKSEKEDPRYLKEDKALKKTKTHGTNNAPDVPKVDYQGDSARSKYGEQRRSKPDAPKSYNRGYSPSRSPSPKKARYRSRSPSAHRYVTFSLQSFL